MQLYYWHAQGPNLGDSLNPWLWPRLLPNFFDDDPRELFIGIGSNFGHTFPANAKKLVCGTGYGAYQAAPFIDETWDIRFVRGPRTAAVLGLDAGLALGDPAVLLRIVLDDVPPPVARRAVGFMPHWESAMYGAWEAVCEEAEVEYIDPRAPLETVMATMRGCELIVTEAMHGAIVADALRVPWVPFMPLPAHHFKWFDWAESQGLTLTFQAGTRSSWLELAFDALHERERFQAFVCRKGLPVKTFGSALLRSRARRAIEQAAASVPYLTDTATMERTIEAMMGCLRQLERTVASR